MPADRFAPIALTTAPALIIYLIVSFLGLPFAAIAQISSETVVNNHDTTREYQRSYTPAAGENRVVIAIIFSEYDLDQNSVVIDATLGGGTDGQSGYHRSAASQA